MAQFVLPVDSLNPYYSFDVALSSIVYRLTFIWNGRGQFWTMDISDTSDNIIQASIKLVASWELLLQYTNPLLPPGSIYCIDMSGLDLDPTDTDLGTRVILVYDNAIN